MHSRLVLCLDGTWNSPFKSVTREDGSVVLKPTNSLKLTRAVRPVDDAGARQCVHPNIRCARRTGASAEGESPAGRKG